MKRIYIYDHANGETYTIDNLEELLIWLNETDYDFSYSFTNNFKETEGAN